MKRSSVVQRPRFIFMGNQPFFYNGEAMELPAGGCRIMDPDELFNLLGIWQWSYGAAGCTLELNRFNSSSLNGDWMCFIPTMSIHWDRNLIIDPYPVMSSCSIPCGNSHVVSLHRLFINSQPVSFLYSPIYLGCQPLSSTRILPVHQLQVAPLVLHLSRDPRWSFRWRTYR